MAAHTGNAGQGVSEFSRMGVGEAVLVVSPNGKVGTGSVVLPWADTQEHPAAGIAEQDGRVIQRGNARLDLRDGHIRLSVGGSTITLIDGTLTIEAETVQVRGTYLRHNARSISDTHVHTDVEPGGSTSGPPL
jgi:phage baseplate assembly protein gpV